MLYRAFGMINRLAGASCRHERPRSLAVWLVESRCPVPSPRRRRRTRPRPEVVWNTDVPLLVEPRHERVQGTESEVDACGRQAVLAEWKNEGVELAVESSRVG